MIEDNLELSPKRQAWLQKKIGCISGSGLARLNTGGRRDMTKSELEKENKGNRKTINVEFGEVAIKYLYQIKYERRTGIAPEEKSLKNFEWGNENEPIAIQWRRDQDFKTIKHCSEDFDDIIFNQPFAGYGDSPDYYILDNDDKIDGLGEIQCCVDQALLERIFSDDFEIDKAVKHYQFISHFIGCPDVTYLEWLVFDAFTFTGKIIRIERNDLETEIQEQIKKIHKASKYIDLCLKMPQMYKLSGINNI